MNELKSCPFCGNEPVVEGNLVACNNLNCPTYDNYWTDPMIFTCDQWNTRPIEDALQAENEWLKEELQQEKTRSQLNLEAEERRMLNITYYCAEIDRLNARIAELESVIDQLIEVSEKMFTAVIAAADSYDEGMREWDKIVNDWKEG